MCLCNVAWSSCVCSMLVCERVYVGTVYVAGWAVFSLFMLASESDLVAP